MTQRTYRDLHPMPLSKALPIRPGTCTITMSEGQWDGLLAAAYADGWTLLEVDDRERPIRAYRKRQDGCSDAD
jgi:hypothetical protein